jgi:hypothetical protein
VGGHTLCSCWTRRRGVGRRSAIRQTRWPRQTVDIIVLDQLLAQYGPDARRARELLRSAVEPLANRIWQENSAAPAEGRSFEATAASETAFAEILALRAGSDPQRSLKARAIEVVNDLAQTRLLLFAQSGTSIPLPFQPFSVRIASAPGSPSCFRSERSEKSGNPTQIRQIQVQIDTK